MSIEPEVTRIVRSWLEEGATTLPDRVLDGVLDQLPATPQRRAHRPAWRLHTMATPIRIAVAAAAIGVLAVVVGIAPRSSHYGGPNSPASPSPTPSPILLDQPGAVAPGTYAIPMGAGRWTVTVPEGWEYFYDILWSDLGVPGTFEDVGGPGEVAFGWWTVDNVFADPCHWKDSLVDPPVGPTVDDLASALVAQAGREGAGPTDVNFGGHPAKRIELSIPADLDVATCDEGVYREWLGPGESLGQVPDPNPVVSGEVSELFVMDIDGSRSVMVAWHHPESSAADVAELTAMLDSVRIDMPAPSATPNP